jgi:hypothetical protein
MKNNVCKLNPQQYYFIWKVSWLSLFSCIYGLYNEHYNIAFAPGCVFLTSINYWRKPEYSWRRYLDINFVIFAFIYTNIRAINAEYYFEYYLLSSVGVCFYPIAIYNNHKERYWLSVYSHCMIHVFGNLANIFLYSGYIL